MVQLVEDMVALQRQLTPTVTPQEQLVLQGHIMVTDRRIDDLVYELYGLTVKEIEVVEAATSIAPPAKMW